MILQYLQNVCNTYSMAGHTLNDGNFKNFNNKIVKMFLSCLHRLMCKVNQYLLKVTSRSNPARLRASSHSKLVQLNAESTLDGGQAVEKPLGTPHVLDLPAEWGPKRMTCSPSTPRTLGGSDRNRCRACGAGYSITDGGKGKGWTENIIYGFEIRGRTVKAWDRQVISSGFTGELRPSTGPS